MPARISDNPEILVFDARTYLYEVQIDGPIAPKRFNQILDWIHARYGRTDGRFIQHRGHAAFAFTNYERAFEFMMVWG